MLLLKTRNVQLKVFVLNAGLRYSRLVKVKGKTQGRKILTGMNVGFPKIIVVKDY